MSLKYPTTSKTLLDKIASGDEISWDEFYLKYSPVVNAIAQYKGLKAPDAEDICQQVMLQFFKQSKTFTFDPDIARFRTYFGRIVKAKIVDFYRRKREIPSMELEAETVDPETDLLYMDEWRKMVLKEAQQTLKQRVTPETFQACSFCKDTGSLKSKTGSIEFCKLDFAFEGDLRGGQVPLKFCKSYRKRRF